MREKHQPLPNKKVKSKTRRRTNKKSEPSKLLDDAEEITEEEKKKVEIIPPQLNKDLVPSTKVAPTEEDKMVLLLEEGERKALVEYQNAGKPQLSVDTAMSFFQLQVKIAQDRLITITKTNLIQLPENIRVLPCHQPAVS